MAQPNLRGNMFSVTHTTAQDSGAAKYRIGLSPSTKVIHIRRIAISNQGAAVNAIVLARCDSYTGGTGATEIGWGSHNPTADGVAVTTTTTGDLTPTNVDVLEKIDLANPDREEWTFPPGQFVLDPKHSTDKCLLIQVPTGSATQTFTVWWQEV